MYYFTTDRPRATTGFHKLFRMNRATENEHFTNQTFSAGTSISGVKFISADQQPALVPFLLSSITSSYKWCPASEHSNPACGLIEIDISELRIYNERISSGSKLNRDSALLWSEDLSLGTTLLDGARVGGPRRL